MSAVRAHGTAVTLEVMQHDDDQPIYAATVNTMADFHEALQQPITVHMQADLFVIFHMHRRLHIACPKARIVAIFKI